MSDRNEHLADELERVATELRSGEATVAGYRVQRDPTERERGGISYSGGWVKFDVEHPDGWLAGDEAGDEGEG